jgi:hypothetical protein
LYDPCGGLLPRLRSFHFRVNFHKEQDFFMNAIGAIRGSLEMADMVGMAYLGDLSDAEFMQRPHPQCNHINWQVGHLISSEHSMLEAIAPGAMPALPAGFAEKYTKDTATSDDPSQFASKDELMQAYKAQRAATLAVLEATPESDLDAETGIHYAPTKGALLGMQGAHWLMHCGQWVIVRRNNGKPVVI